MGHPPLASSCSCSSLPPFALSPFPCLLPLLPFPLLPFPCCPSPCFPSLAFPCFPSYSLASVSLCSPSPCSLPPFAPCCSWPLCCAPGLSLSAPRLPCCAPGLSWCSSAALCMDSESQARACFMIRSFIIFGASNHLGETSKHHFRSQDSKMLQNEPGNAWNTVPQDSRTTPAGLPHHSRRSVAEWVASFSGPWGGQGISQPFF